MQLDRDSASILDMVVAGRRIQEFIMGQDYAEFSADLKTQSAVIHRVPVKALFENLEGGASVDDFLEWFPGVTREQIEAVLKVSPEGDHARPTRSRP